MLVPRIADGRFSATNAHSAGVAVVLYTTRDDARADVFNFEMFYNPRQRHSSAAGLSPVEFEQRHSQRLTGV